MTSTDSQPVILEVAGVDHAPILGNLLELYSHDLSNVFGLEVGADGRYGYPRLSLYWSEPDRRRAFLIRHGAHLAGFILVRMESSRPEAPADWDVAEFFVLRAHRRHGVGRDAAFQVWDRHPGVWTVRVAEGNAAAHAFWKTTIDEYAAGAFTESRRSVDGRDWNVFVFPSRDRARRA